MLSSKGEAKQEARFAARLDVLTERVDTLASTVATTASAIAKKDGEIAALQRAFESRDETLRALVEHVNRAAQATASADAPVDANELRSLRNAVAALTKERAGMSASEFERLLATVRALDQRVEALAAAAAAPRAPVPDPATTARIDVLAAELAGVRSAVEHPPAELVATMSALRGQVDDLAAGLESSVTQEALARRFGETDNVLEDVSRRLDSLAEKLDRRLETAEETRVTFAHRLEALDASLERLERLRAVAEERLDQRIARTDDVLASVARRVDALQSVDGAQLELRLGETDAALARLSERLDTLVGTVESATAGIGAKERELAGLHSHFTESSTRIESIVDDIREALHAFPMPSSASLDDVATRLERLEASARRSAESSARIAGELSGRIELSDHRLAAVAEEVSRAKTLWPVALRSLEARLDDAVHGRGTEHRDEGVSDAQAPDEPPDDLLAGLRDSLRTMESVAAEMARASETLGEPDDEPPVADAHPATSPSPPEQAAAGGATIVPLRTGEP